MSSWFTLGLSKDSAVKAREVRVLGEGYRTPMKIGIITYNMLSTRLEPLKYPKVVLTPRWFKLPYITLSIFV